MLEFVRMEVRRQERLLKVRREWARKLRVVEREYGRKDVRVLSEEGSRRRCRRGRCGRGWMGWCVEG